jgi:hypothetical protein
MILKENLPKSKHIHSYTYSNKQNEINELMNNKEHLNKLEEVVKAVKKYS